MEISHIIRVNDPLFKTEENYRHAAAAQIISKNNSWNAWREACAGFSGSKFFMQIQQRKNENSLTLNKFILFVFTVYLKHS